MCTYQKLSYKPDLPDLCKVGTLKVKRVKSVMYRSVLMSNISVTGEKKETNEEINNNKTL